MDKIKHTHPRNVHRKTTKTRVPSFYGQRRTNNDAQGQLLAYYVTDILNLNRRICFWTSSVAKELQVFGSLKWWFAYELALDTCIIINVCYKIVWLNDIEHQTYRSFWIRFFFVMSDFFVSEEAEISALVFSRIWNYKSEPEGDNTFKTIM